MLSHPFIVDAAQSSFVPLCIFNNTEGDHDAEVRELFEEPAWNNPVVRFLDEERSDIVPRNGDDWTVGGMARRMASVLREGDEPLPGYLALFVAEEGARARGVESAVFGMT